MMLMLRSCSQVEQMSEGERCFLELHASTENSEHNTINISQIYTMHIKGLTDNMQVAQRKKFTV